MDKYEYKLKAEEIRTLAANKQYIEAMQIADTIDWTRVKSVMMLNVVSEIYKMNRRYQESKDILLLAFERNPGSRSILYSLCELSIKMEEFVQAVEYYKEFVQAAPKDTGRYILQYRIYEAQDVSLEERIGVLEEFKQRDYREKWAYELAFLYHRIGLSTRCVEECDELILWFGEGKYVTKAMELKMLHEPLTPAQQEKFDKTARKKRVPHAVEDEFDIHVKPMDMSQYNTINLQQELAASMQEFMGESQETEEDPYADTMDAPYQEDTNVSLDEGEMYYQQPIHKDSEEVFFEDETGELGEYQEEVEEPNDLNNTQEYDDSEDYDSSEEFEEQTEEPVIEIEPLTDVTDRQDMPFAKMLSQEYDGQISLVVPDAEKLEKQITGQMSIQEILLEWEKMKKDNEQKRREDVRQRVLEQTSDMFSEFDASTKKGILEDLNALANAVAESEELLNEEETVGEEEYYEEEPAEEEYYEEEPAEEEYYEEEPAEEEYYGEETAEEYYEDYPEGEEAYYEEQPEGEEAYYEEQPEGGEEYYEEQSEGEEAYYEDYAEGEEAYYENYSEDEDAQVRDLTEEQKKLFSSFISSDKNKLQIIETMDKMTLAAYTGNVLISGDMGTGTMKLAKNLIKEMRQTDRNFSGKVAKISGETLNSKNIPDTVNRLKNGALLVEKAGALSVEALQDMTKALEQENNGIIVVLEDTKKEIDKLLERHQKIAENFNARIDIDELNNDVLVAHGREYAEDQEYSMDDLAILALYTRIAEMQTSEHAVNFKEVEEIVEEAIHHADKKNLSHFVDLLVGKRYDEEDMIVLREKDFLTY